MLLLTKSLEDVAVMSLQTGGKLGDIGAPVIDPRTLQVVAYHVTGPRVHEDSVLHTADIREVGPLGIIVNDANNIMPINDGLVRLEEVLAMRFTLTGKAVVDESKTKLGKITDYAVDSEGFKILKLYVGQSVMKNLGNSSLIIDRSQIVDVSDTQITVRSGAVRQSAGLAQTLNPFRRQKGSLAAE